MTLGFGVCPQGGRCGAAQPTARIVLGAERSSFLTISVSSGAILGLFPTKELNATQVTAKTLPYRCFPVGSATNRYMEDPIGTIRSR